MYSYKNRVSYSQLDKEGKLGVSNVVDAMQDCCLFTVKISATVP